MYSRNFLIAALLQEAMRRGRLLEEETKQASSSKPLRMHVDEAQHFQRKVREEKEPQIGPRNRRERRLAKRGKNPCE